MIHIIIAKERRVSTKEKPRELALVMSADIVTQTGVGKDGMPTYTTTPKPPQLHTMGERIDDMSNILYAAEWDQKSPWLTIIKGDPATPKMQYAGWPMVDETTWRELNPEPKL